MDLMFFDGGSPAAIDGCERDTLRFCSNFPGEKESVSRAARESTPSMRSKAEEGSTRQHIRSKRPDEDRALVLMISERTAFVRSCWLSLAITSS